MKKRRSSLEHSLLRESNPQRRQILLLLSQLHELGIAYKPDLGFRRRQFVRRIRILKQISK